MVKLHIKKGDESQFLFETTCSIEMNELLPELVRIYNGRLKVERLNYGGFVNAFVNLSQTFTKCFYSNRIRGISKAWDYIATKHAGVNG